MKETIESIEHLIASVDNMNAWEVFNCFLKDYPKVGGERNRRDYYNNIVETYNCAYESTLEFLREYDSFAEYGGLKSPSKFYEKSE